MYCVFDAELPPGLRQACHMAHSFCLLKESPAKAFSPPILLGSMWNTMEYFHSKFLKFFSEFEESKFASHVTHYSMNIFLVLDFDHSNEIKPCLISGSFILQESNPTMTGKVIKKSYNILIFMITKYR